LAAAAGDLEHEHYGSSKKKGAWDGGLLLKSGRRLPRQLYVHPLVAAELLVENRETIAQINRRLGYRIQLREINWPAEVALARRSPSKHNGPTPASHRATAAASGR